jgi:UDP-N-acetyl-D-glucosamine dehydrogenase
VYAVGMPFAFPVRHSRDGPPPSGLGRGNTEAMISHTAGLELTQKIHAAQARVAVIGLGYVGLPLATAFAEAGLSVVGLDVDDRKVAAVMEGVSYIDDIDGDILARQVEEGRLHATADADVLAEVDAAVICVPTPFSKAKQPDLSHILQAGVQIREHLHPEQLIVLESTTYPGTTQEVLLPLLETGGLRCGVDFELAYSPERVDPGNPRYGLKNTPKIVAGVTPRARDLATALYRHVTDQVVTVSEPRVAETAKLLENTFRHVNIALANEMALLCGELGINIWEVIDAAATKPFGFMPFYPGPGVGGHCIPIDPFYFSWKCRENDRQARLIELAGEINDRMPEVVVDRVTEALNIQGKSLMRSRVLVLGVSYKKDVGDVRESPALKVIDRLHRRGAEVSYHDPYVPICANGKGPMASVNLDDETLARADCVVILTDHRNLPYEQIIRTAPAVVDTRNALRQFDAPNVVRL